MCSAVFSPFSLRPDRSHSGPALLMRMFLAIALWAGMACHAFANGNEVVIVYSAGDADSKAVAEHYAKARNVPTSNWIGLKLTSSSVISRSNYIAQIEQPLLRELSSRGLMSFTNFVEPPSEYHPGGPAIRCTSASVRYLVLCWGLPYHISNDPGTLVGVTTNIPSSVRRTDASVDSELSLLPAAGTQPLVAGVPNPFYGATNRTAFHPTNGVFLVGRIDGPSPAIAKGLVDKALHCETNGFAGNAYIDLRGIASGPYQLGDQWMTNAADACRRVGLSTYVDHREATFPTNFPLSNVGVYIGWYTQNVDGPFTLPEVEFMPGAIAYHLHSFNGQFPRDPATRWLGPLLAKGATVTFGSVAEPYLEFTPNPHVFMQFLAAGGFTVGEASLTSQKWLSWVNIFVGDPLFTPFERDLTRLEARQVARQSPNLHWTVLRKANVLIAANPTGASALRQALATYPLSTNSPILSEKVAALFAQASQYQDAIAWGKQALTLSPSPQQRLRLLLNLAEWQSTATLYQDAFQSLLLIEKEREDYRDSLPFRERQLQAARDLVRGPEIERIKAEISRLKASSAKPTP